MRHDSNKNFSRVDRSGKSLRPEDVCQVPGCEKDPKVQATGDEASKEEGGNAPSGAPKRRYAAAYLLHTSNTQLVYVFPSRSRYVFS
jgi:hypothetical protein